MKFAISAVRFQVLAAAVSVAALMGVTPPLSAAPGDGLGGARGGALGGLGIGGGGSSIGAGIGSSSGVIAGASTNTRNGFSGTVNSNVLNDQSNATRVNTNFQFGGTNARLGTNGGTTGAGLGLGISLGGIGSGTPDTRASTSSIGRELAGLSSRERMQLKRKCRSVLASPGSYNRDAVKVCSVLAQLSGL